MATFVMSDIHGCYDKLQQMLEMIRFSDTDRLILAGDYIDRGRQSYEMLLFLTDHPDNIHPICGNHDEEFAGYVDLMEAVDEQEQLQTDRDSQEDLKVLYDSVRYYFAKHDRTEGTFFDYYGTIRMLLQNPAVNFGMLRKWRDVIHRMSYSIETKSGSRTCIVVHAGYRTDLEDEDALINFFLYARNEAYIEGGLPGGMVVAGHTPTLAKGFLTYTGGDVFRHYNPQKDCIFYNIDCGCVYRHQYPGAKLACLRLDDEEVFYV